MQIKIDGIPIKWAMLLYTPSYYKEFKSYSKTLCKAIVIDKRQAIDFKKENGFSLPILQEYPCSLWSAFTTWKDEKQSILIMKVLVDCLQLLLKEEIDKKEIVKVLHSITETKYLLNDEILNFFGLKTPSDENKENFNILIDNMFSCRAAKKKHIFEKGEPVIYKWGNSKKQAIFIEYDKKKDNYCVIHPDGCDYFLCIPLKDIITQKKQRRVKHVEA